MTLDFTFERRLELQREEAWKQGTEYGEKNGMQKKQQDLIRKKIIKRKSLEQIAEELEELPDDIRPIYEQIQKEMDGIS